MENKTTIQKGDKRTTWMHIRLTPKEEERLKARAAKSTSPNLSSYIRRVLLDKPVTLLTRSRSLDEFTQEMILLKNELSAIGSNVNQQAKKMNSYATTPSLKLMLASYRLLKGEVDSKVTQIKNKLNGFSELWLQESSAEKASGEQ